MQVYKITPTVACSYGCALVAADSKEQAITTYRNDEYKDWNYDFLECECCIVEKLHYYCEESTVILNDIGAE